MLALGAAGFAAFKAGANAGGDDEDDEEFYEEPEAEAKPAGNPFASFTEKKTAPPSTRRRRRRRRRNSTRRRSRRSPRLISPLQQQQPRPQPRPSARSSPPPPPSARKPRRQQRRRLIIRRDRSAEDTPGARAGRHLAYARACARRGGSLLPRGFPTVADLAECESAEEKAELCDKADLLVERLEAKADSAEAFVDGPICAFFGFLKPNAIRNAEKARAAAEEAAAAAAALRRAAAGGPAAASSRAPSRPRRRGRRGRRPRRRRRRRRRAPRQEVRAPRLQDPDRARREAAQGARRQGFDRAGVYPLLPRAGAQGGDGTLRPRGVEHGGEGDQG